MMKFGAVGLLIVVLFIDGCSLNAPHDNPLDPQSPSYKGSGSVSGRVTLINFPGSGVASVHVYTLPSTFEVVTDSIGYYQLPEIPAGKYTLIASKYSLTPDTTNFQISIGEHLSINFSMNAFPTILSTKVLTRKIDQWWPNPVYFAEITATVDDVNGISDIDSVWFNVDSLMFPMAYSLADKNFHLTIYSYQFPSNNIEWLVGKQLYIVARDLTKSIGRSNTFFISRVIEQEAVPSYPEFQDTTTVSPVFTWVAPSVRFLYTYTLTVVRMDAGTQETVWTQDNIGNYLLSYTYPSTLTTGNYFWTISVVDEYGNYSCSKQSSFVVN